MSINGAIQMANDYIQSDGHIKQLKNPTNFLREGTLVKTLLFQIQSYPFNRFL